MTFSDEWAARFEANRNHLRTVAYRVVGSAAEAEDVVQEAWLRFSRVDPATIENLQAWLTTVVGRIALDLLRSRGLRRSEGSERVEQVEVVEIDPLSELDLADELGGALTVVLDRLNPSERVAFVLHDTFAVPFEDLGTLLERSPAAAKQLASRARQKVRGGTTQQPAVAIDRHAEVVRAFLRAAREGDLAGLVSLLAPDVVLAADAACVRMGAPAASLGAEGVGRMFSGRALGAELAIVDGAPGLAWFVGGTLRVAWNFYIEAGTIVHIDMHGEADLLRALEVRPADLPEGS